MLNNFKGLYSVVFIFFIGSFMASNAVVSKAGNKIKNLSVTTSSRTPSAGDVIEKLTIKFRLKSKTGISQDRLKIFFNSTEISQRDIQREIIKDNVHDYTLVLNDQVAVQGKNKVKVQYFLTSSSSVILASASANFIAKTNNNNEANETQKVIEEKIAYISVEEVSDRLGEVSLEEKQFRITVEYNQELIPSQSLEEFIEKNSVILQNLTIKSRDSDTQKTNLVRDNYSFSLETERTSSPDNDNFIISTFISDPILIKEAQTITFKLDFEDFIDSIDPKLGNKKNLSDSTKIKIAPITLNLSNVDIVSNEDKVLFMPYSLSSLKKQELFNHNSINITADLNSSYAPTENFEAISFIKTNSKGKKLFPKIKASQKKKADLKFRVKAQDNLVIDDLGNSNYKISIPINTKVETSRNFFLLNNDFTDSSKIKEISIPISIKTKSVNDLDMLILGSLEKEEDLEFIDDPRFTEINKSSLIRVDDDLLLNLTLSNTVGNEFDSLNAQLKLFDSDGKEIGDPIEINNFSPIISNDINSKKKVKASKKIRANLNELFPSRILSASELDAANSVEIKLIRSESFLNQLGLEDNPVTVTKENQTATESTLRLDITK